MAKIPVICIIPGIEAPYFSRSKNTIPVGIAESIILSTVYLGKYKFRFGRTIIILSKKYKKLAKNVANPTPANPIFGISMIFKIIPKMPETNLITNSICVLFARWYCRVV